MTTPPSRSSGALARARGLFTTVLVVVGFLVAIPTFLLVIALPGMGVIAACTRWVLGAPGGAPWYPTAFAGLFVGAYLLPSSLCAGTFDRRLSRRVARLSPIRLAAAAPGELIAIDAHVVSGRAARPYGNMPRPDADDERWVGYPLVLQDAAGDTVRVETWDGQDDPAADSLGFGVARIGDRVVAVGEVRRVEHGSSVYRGPSSGLRLVRGEQPLFRVRPGDLAGLVAERRAMETSPAWGLTALASLAIGVGSILAAQSLAP